MKLCKDCRFFVPDELYPQCSESSLQQQSLVTGEMERVNCSAARIYGCGAEGKLFVPNNALLDKLEAEFKRDQEIAGERFKAESFAALMRNAEQRVVRGHDI